MSSRAVRAFSAGANGSGSARLNWGSTACAAIFMACRSASESISRECEWTRREEIAARSPSSTVPTCMSMMAASRRSTAATATAASARDAGADIVLLAGDTFDNHMVSAATVERAGRVLAEADVPIVLLPGNHDPVTADSVYLRGRYGDIPGLHILGLDGSGDGA